MRFAVALPWWGLALVVVAAVLLGWRAYASAVTVGTHRRAVLTALRTAALLTLVAMLLKPVMERPDPDGQGLVVPILVDVSRSMRLADAAGETREAVAARLVAQVQSGLSGIARPEVWRIGAGLAPWSSPPAVSDDPRSDLRGALAAVMERYRGRRLAGVVLLSDGGDTGPAASSRPGVPDAPVFAIGVGSPVIGRDRELRDLSAGSEALPGATVDLTVTAVSHGYGTAPLDLRVRVNGQPTDVRRVERVADGVPVRAVVRVAPASDAATVVTIDVPEANGELTAGNNTRRLLIEPAGRARRVLLLEGSPAHEHAFIRRALTADAALDIDVVARKGQDDRGRPTFLVQAASGRAAALTRGFPADRARLFAYDGVVLANVDPDTVAGDDLEALAAFVEQRGGGLLAFGARTLARGALATTPLARVLPVDLAGRSADALPAVQDGGRRAAMAPTREGDAHPAVRVDADPAESRRRWAALPPLGVVHPVGALKPAASVLLVAAEAAGGWSPLVVTGRHGDGRAAVFAGEGTWRWRMARPAADTTFESVWRQLVRWLVAGSAASVEVLRPDDLVPGTTVPISIRVRDERFLPVGDADVRLRLTAPGGARTEVAATRAASGDGIYVAPVRLGEAGLYEVAADVSAPSVPFVTVTRALLAGGADRELADPRLNREVLERLSQTSGGAYLEADDVARLPALLRAAVRESSVTTVDLWHNGAVLLVLMSVLGAEWTLRRRWGLA